MNRKLLLALLGCTVLAMISPRSALATVGSPLQGIPVGLEGDPGSIIVATTKTDAEGKFEFKNLKAGNYRLVDQSAEGAGKQTTVLDGAQLQLQRTFTITVTPVNDAPTTKVDNKLTGRLTLPVDPKSGRSSQVITIDMDGGTVKGVIGELQDADDLPSRPQSRRATIAPMPTKNQPGPTDLPVTLRDGPEGTVIAKEAPGSPAGRAPFKIGENESPMPTTRQAPGSPMPPVPGAATGVQVPDGGTVLLGGVPVAPGAASSGWRKVTLEWDDGQWNAMIAKGIVLGVTVQPVDGGGLSITSVNKGSLAQKLGLQTGDHISEINGIPVNSQPELVAQLKATSKKAPAAKVEPPLEEVSFTFRRNGQVQALELRRDGAWYVGGGGAAKASDQGDPMPKGGLVTSYPATSNGDEWRYKQHNGEWWYWTPEEKWLVNRNGQWVDPDATGTASRTPVAGKAELPKAAAAIGNRVRIAVGDLNGDGKADTGTATPSGAVPGGGFIPGLPGRKLPAAGKSPSPAGGLRGAFGS